MANTTEVIATDRVAVPAGSTERQQARERGAAGRDIRNGSSTEAPHTTQTAQAAVLRSIGLRDVRNNEKVRAYIEKANEQMAVDRLFRAWPAPCRAGRRDCPQHLSGTGHRGAHCRTRRHCRLSARHRQLRPPHLSSADRRDDGVSTAGSDGHGRRRNRHGHRRHRQP